MGEGPENGSMEVGGKVRDPLICIAMMESRSVEVMAGSSARLFCASMVNVAVTAASKLAYVDRQSEGLAKTVRAYHKQLRINLVLPTVKNFAVIFVQQLARLLPVIIITFGRR